MSSRSRAAIQAASQAPPERIHTVPKNQRHPCRVVVEPAHRNTATAALGSSPGDIDVGSTVRSPRTKKETSWPEQGTCLPLPSPPSPCGGGRADLRNEGGSFCRIKAKGIGEVPISSHVYYFVEFPRCEGCYMAFPLRSPYWPLCLICLRFSERAGGRANHVVAERGDAGIVGFRRV